MLSVLVALGLDPQTCLPALAELSSLPRHCSLQSIDLPGGQIQILDDSFSSNPASLRSALETLALLTVAGSGAMSGRRLLVLGAIDELGERSEELHVSLADPIMRFGIDRVYAYGDQARHTCAALPASTVALHTLSAAELRDALLADLRPEDWLILKFSRHSNLGERLWPALRSLSTGPT
jgi:UDP-N-acetylmuramoyl-tripeptide--D-alanyl-D-alanine ligase